MTRVGTANEARREAWIAHKLAALPAGWRLLDAGAGEQRHRSLCGHLEYVAQDFAAYRPDADEIGLQMPQWDYGQLDIISDICAIPLLDASFDAVLCTEVLEHVPSPRSALLELARLLRPGGILLLTAPFCSLTHFSPHHYVSGFSRHYFTRVLSECGLEVCSIEPNGGFFDFLAQELRRSDSVASRYAGVRPRWCDRVGLRLVLGWLQAAADRDAGSSELLTFGFHVEARRG